MKILVEIPNWLGDAVMATPAVLNILKAYPEAEILFLGSAVSLNVFKNFVENSKFIVNDSKSHKFRLLYLAKFGRNLGEFDVAISFRKSFSSKFMMKFLKAKEKFSYKRIKNQKKHLVIRYNDFINHSLGMDFKAEDLKLFYKPFKFQSKTLGINPGATYGSAKRWYPGEFAKVGVSLSKEYDIVIFGSKNEMDMAGEIEGILVKNGVKNYQNLAGKTSVSSLIEMVAGLSLFITNDSGPMHIAAAYKIPTLAIFGPTDYSETSQWMNENSVILTKNLPCSPCMKRVCPFGHHNCMKTLSADEALKAIKKLEISKVPEILEQDKKRGKNG